MNPCPEVVSPWWHWHPYVGVFIVIFGLVGVLVPFLNEHLGEREKAVWTSVLVILAMLELRTIHYDGIEHDAIENRDRCIQLNSFQQIGNGIKQELDNTTQLLELEKQSRVPNLTREEQAVLIKKWGQVSKFQSKAIDGAIATPDHPREIQPERRPVNAEDLGKILRKEDRQRLRLSTMKQMRLRISQTS
jgi:hypothetical protein